MRNISPKYPADLLLPLDPNKVSSEIEKYASAQDFAAEQRKKYEAEKNPALGHLKTMSAAINQHERKSKSLGEATMNADFYYMGGIIGLSVMEAEKGSEFASELFCGLDTISITNVDHLDEADYHTAIIEVLTDMSDYGLELARPYQPMIGYLGKLLSAPERAGRQFVERGFGMTAFMACGLVMRNSLVEAEMQKFDLTLGAGELGNVDWDSGWAELDGLA